MSVDGRQPERRGVTVGPLCSRTSTPGEFHSPTVSGTSVLLLLLSLFLLLLLLHHVESDSALQHLHREPRIDSYRDRREEEKQLLPETTLSHLISSHHLLLLAGWVCVCVSVYVGGGEGRACVPVADMPVIVEKAHRTYRSEWCREADMDPLPQHFVNTGLVSR